MRLRLERVTAPQITPVTLAEAKQQLRLEPDQSDDDALITGLIATAVEQAERWTGRALIRQVWRMFLDAWPGEAPGNAWEGIREGPSSLIAPSPAEVWLAKLPLISVAHVKTYDDSDVASSWAPSNYVVDTASEPGRIVPRKGASWPTPGRAANGIEIEFTAGYGANAHDVPEGIRQGILGMVEKLHDGCDPEDARKAAQAETLWQAYRVLHL